MFQLSFFYIIVISDIYFALTAGYKDLLSRKDIREAAWRKPGWDECVAYTGNYVFVTCIEFLFIFLVLNMFNNFVILQCNLENFGYNPL